MQVKKTRFHPRGYCSQSQLAKENKKFVYSMLKKGGRAKEFEDAIQWINDAGLIYKVERVKCKVESIK